MSLQNFSIIDLYIDFPVTLKRCFILNCSDGIIKFFCDCIFNVVKGIIKLEKKVRAKIAVLSTEKSIIEALCSKRKISMKRKRQLLVSPRGLRLLKIILPSVLNHLKSCHDIKR